MGIFLLCLDSYKQLFSLLCFQFRFVNSEARWKKQKFHNRKDNISNKSTFFRTGSRYSVLMGIQMLSRHLVATWGHEKPKIGRSTRAIQKMPARRCVKRNFPAWFSYFFLFYLLPQPILIFDGPARSARSYQVNFRSRDIKNRKSDYLIFGLDERSIQ